MWKRRCLATKGTTPRKQQSRVLRGGLQPSSTSPFFHIKSYAQSARNVLTTRGPSPRATGHRACGQTRRTRPHWQSTPLPYLLSLLPAPTAACPRHPCLHQPPAASSPPRGALARFQPTTLDASRPSRLFPGRRLGRACASPSWTVLHASSLHLLPHRTAAHAIQFDTERATEPLSLLSPARAPQA